MDLFGRRIVGWHTSKRMTTDLVEHAFLKAHSLRQPPKGIVFHSDSNNVIAIFYCVNHSLMMHA
jgi:transposase InsO family protein